MLVAFLGNDSKDIPYIINNLNFDTVVIVNENTLCTKTVRKCTFLRGIKTIGFDCDNNKTCNTIMVNNCRPNIIYIFGNLEKYLHNICKSLKISIIHDNNYICGQCGQTTEDSKTCYKECVVLTNTSLELEPINEVVSIPKNNSFNLEKKEDEFTNLCTKTFGSSEIVPTLNPQRDKSHKTFFVNTKQQVYLAHKKSLDKELKLQNNNKKVPSYTNLRKKRKSKMCQAKTKKTNRPCSNKAINGTDYCGIASHKAMSYVT